MYRGPYLLPNCSILRTAECVGKLMPTAVQRTQQIVKQSSLAEDLTPDIFRTEIKFFRERLNFHRNTLKARGKARRIGGCLALVLTSMAG